MNIKWNAEKYTSDFSFVHRYGNDVIGLIDAAPGGSVLDLGCGNGALSHALHEKGYRVVGLDASAELLEVARTSYPDLDFRQGDATDFELSEPMDVVFSNAVFHWIDRERQPEMLRCVRRALRRGGQFVFEFGGFGNNGLIHTALAKIFAVRGYRYEMPFYFPTVGEYAVLLEQAGFCVRFALLFDRPTELRGETGLKDWITMFVKTPFDAVASTAEKEAILADAQHLLRPSLFRDGTWYADYVRLRMKATLME